MKLIVGLGNVGEKYKKTRHNVGFLCVEALVETENIGDWRDEKKFFGAVVYGQIENEKVVILKPNTYMNESGKSVSALTRFYKIKPSDVFVLFDDVDLPFGTIRFREKGQSGGHNGIKSIIQSLGSTEFPRIKIGIGNEQKQKIDTADFVLGKFMPEEQKKLPSVLKKGIETLLQQL